MNTSFNGSAATITAVSSMLKQSSIKQMRRLLVSAFVAVSVLATSNTALAADYIRDIDWAKIKCARIPEIVSKLHSLADYLHQQAEVARAEGNDALADAYDAAAMEATIEAAEGVFHYSTGDCVQ